MPVPEISPPPLAALRKKSEALVNAAIVDMDKLCRSADFHAISAAKERYQTFPPETGVLYNALNDRWDSLVLEAKESLRELRASTDPKHIELDVTAFDPYGEVRQQLIKERRGFLL